MNYDGSVWQDDEGDTMVLEIRPNSVYGISGTFDFERDTIEEALAQLKTWGYRHVGTDV